MLMKSGWLYFRAGIMVGPPNPADVLNIKLTHSCQPADFTTPTETQPEKIAKTMLYESSPHFPSAFQPFAEPMLITPQVHLGDYIYEGAERGPRAHNPPRLLFTLGDYRTRHSQYRLDPDLQLLAASHAFITTWDDHEVSNNGYRDGASALNNTEESFLDDSPRISVDQRKMNAVRAYFEWMPIRQADLDDNLRIWRSFRIGKLLDLVVLDTRNYDRSITDLGWNVDYIPLISNDAGRSLMGSHQENWFYRQLSESSNRGATYRVVANQIIFSRILEEGELNGDSWDVSSVRLIPRVA